jgi:hypothetical protein
MARGKKTRKCQKCGIDDTLMEEMEVEYRGKNNTPYWFHKDCYAEHLKEKEFKKKESEELNHLVEVIESIYGEPMPKQAYPYIQEMRNGEQFFGRENKRHKKGHPYSLIAETFQYCTEPIEYSLKTKDFSGFMSKFKYGLAIVADKISIVESRKRHQEKMSQAIENRLNEVDEEEYEEYKPTYKKKAEEEVKLSDFLD